MVIWRELGEASVFCFFKCFVVREEFFETFWKNPLLFGNDFLEKFLSFTSTSDWRINHQNAYVGEAGMCQMLASFYALV